MDDDARLMRCAKTGDDVAFAALVRRYEGALRRVAESRLRTVEAAEDVVQETFLAAYKSKHSYDERFGFRTWLWTILLNQCRRHASRQARRPHVVSMHSPDLAEDSQQPAEMSSGGDESVLASLLARERRELLYELLGRLSSVQADALRLRFFGELKFQEIADTMQCSLCTAKNRVRWGLLHLAEMVQEQSTEKPVSGGEYSALRMTSEDDGKSVNGNVDHGDQRDGRTRSRGDSPGSGGMQR